MSSSLVTPPSPWTLLSTTRPTKLGVAASLPARRPVSMTKAPIIAFCHLHWNGVWQRPQQLLSRLAVSREVLFVETHRSEVLVSEGLARTAVGHPRVTILETHLPSQRWNEGDFIDAERRRVLLDFCRNDERFQEPVLWFNDPMAVTAFAGHCGERAIVYDCMDELAQFKGAPPELRTREQELLARADVVFCGGRKMREKRLPLNRNCHFYGTGVDSEHFGRACEADTAVDPQIAALPGKVLGYFGVIDERIDYALLDELAVSLPDCTIAMVGPVAKVDPATFPQRPNLRWLGRRDYADLPAITKGFAVCLMPFARNPATEYINPTKALEYMAAGRPVVSTALDEVKSNFSKVCRIAETPGEFIAFCREEAFAPDQKRVARGLTLAAGNSWEAITDKMDAHIATALEARVQPAAPAAMPLLITERGLLTYV